MSVGTLRGTSSTSPVWAMQGIHKRRRRSPRLESRESEQSEATECPVCFERTEGDRVPRTSFDCCHVICDRCDDEMFTRADDRCPVCRAARAQASIREQCVSNQVARNAAAAHIHNQQSGGMLLFFPVEPMSEMALPHFILERHERTSTEVPSVAAVAPSVAASLNTAASIANDPLVSSVVHGLLNPSSVPLSQFFESVGELRGRGRLVYSTSMRRRTRN